MEALGCSMEASSYSLKVPSYSTETGAILWFTVYQLSYTYVQYINLVITSNVQYINWVIPDVQCINWVIPDVQYINWVIPNVQYINWVKTGFVSSPWLVVLCALITNDWYVSAPDYSSCLQPDARIQALPIVDTSVGYGRSTSSPGAETAAHHGRYDALFRTLHFRFYL